MSLRINRETQLGLKEALRKWILQSRVGQSGEDLPPSTVEFSLLDAISTGQITADRIESLRAIAWYRIVSNAPPGGLGYRETDNTLILLKLLDKVLEEQEYRDVSGYQIFLMLQEVLAEINVQLPICRIDAPRKEASLDFLQTFMADHPPMIRKEKRQ